MAEPFLSIQQVRKAFGATTVVQDFNLDVEPGEFVSFLGPSGCGKTTVLRMVAGFEEPSAGKIVVAGKDITRLKPNQRNVGMVFQAYALFPNLTVAQNIGFGLKVAGMPKADADRRVAEMLDLIKLPQMGDRYPYQLSGGQQQRIALARAIAPKPKLLLLDEPLSALDFKLRKDMQIELKRLQHETGITFIFVTHDQEEALTMSDRIAVMSSGKILQVGTPWDIYDKPAERFVADFIGETNFLTAAISGMANGKARATLKSGATIDATVAEGFQPKDNATVVVRPEHAKLTSGKGDLSGTVENIVYFGTDTHIHVRLDSSEAFTVRQQNTRSAGCGFERGDKVGISIGNDAAQVLRD
ncbi:MAG: ABC transporter ATP-binding protein [Mesorhizobium sp.]|nr:MAG: ABC transporter ATP-binding protein [Mesorhizobium sp.]